jgi:hypothetical protein
MRIKFFKIFLESKIENYKSSIIKKKIIFIIDEKKNTKIKKIQRLIKKKKFKNFELNKCKFFKYAKNIYKKKFIKEIYNQAKLLYELRFEIYSNYLNKNLKELIYCYPLKINKNDRLFEKNNRHLHLESKHLNQNIKKIDSLMKNLKKKILFKVSIFKEAFLSCSCIHNKLIRFLNLVFDSFYLTKIKKSKKFISQKINVFLFDTFELGKKYIQINGIKYLKLELIGKGGSGKVYKIISDQNKIFALKKTKIKSYGI